MSIPVKTIKTNRATMKYFSFGEGEKNLVLVPGVGIRDTSLAADLVADYYSPFTADYTVYVFDTREDMPSEYTIEEMTEDLYEAMRELGIKKAYFNGCSMGGMILSTMLVKHPEVINKAVLSSTTHHIHGLSEKVIGNWYDLTKARDLKQLAEVSSQEVYTEEYYNTYYDALMEYHLNATEKDCQKFEAQLQAILNFYNKEFETIKDDPKNDLIISRDVLAIAAKGDKGIEYTDSLKMAELTGCKCYIYEGMSHAVYDEAPDFLYRIKAFFEE